MRPDHTHPGFQQTIIFDVDGTLADIEHRRHWVQDKPKNWHAFNNTMHLDTPHHDIIWLLHLMHNAGATILVASGRGEESREVTEDWLKTHGVSYAKLYMRPAKDYRGDDVIKMEILDQMRADGWNPTMAVDDRSRVVDAWRNAGLRCLQVNPGDF